MGKVLTFGELLLRICPDGEGQWLAENKLPFYIGGAELNVATALALWEIPSAYFTALPDNFMGNEMIGYMQECRIDTARIHRGGERIGIYYLPKGKDLKNAGVIYDRAQSSFATLKTGTLNWDEIFREIDWFHFSAICPALNQDAADICLEAVKAANERNITISIDLNYRAKLWQYGRQPDEVIPELVQYCDLVMGNIWAAEKMLDIPVSPKLAEIDSKEKYLEQSKQTSETILARYPKCKWVAHTFRFDHKNGVRYYTTLFTQDELFVSDEYLADTILDKVGSGDCFMAGLIYGLFRQKDPLNTLNFATAAAFNKLFIPSDCTTSTLADIERTRIQHAEK